MGAKTLSTIVLGTFLTATALGQQTKKDWYDIVLKFKGKDTVLYKDAKSEYSMILDEDKYKVFRSESFNQFTPEQCSTPWDNALVEKALRRKNIVEKYSTLEDAMSSLVVMKNDNYRVMESNIDEYFKVASEAFPKPNNTVGQALKGEEREFYKQCREIAQKLSETNKDKNSERGIDYLIRYLDNKLLKVNKITDQNSGAIFLSKDADGKDIYVVVAEYPPSESGTFADKNYLPLKNTYDILNKYAQTVLANDGKKHKDRLDVRSKPVLWELINTDKGTYKVAVVFWNIGTEKEDIQIKQSITETYKLIEEK